MSRWSPFTVMVSFEVVHEGPNQCSKSATATAAKTAAPPLFSLESTDSHPLARTVCACSHHKRKTGRKHPLPARVFVVGLTGFEPATP